MRRILNFMAVVMLAAAAAAATARAQGGEDSLEQRLADAQRRLEDAAREVAELSGEAAGPGAFQQFEYFLPGPRRAMLGVNLGGAEPNGGGVRIESVSPGGPAQGAGVKAGDIIVAVEDRPVTTGRELVRAMEAVKPGDKVGLALKRDGKPLKVAVEARPLDHALFIGTPGVPAVHPLPALPALGDLPHGGAMHWLLEDWGDAEFVTLTPALGRYFGAEKGVLVARAPEGADLGLQDGDVILAIGGREPQSGSHAMRILRSYQPGEAVELRILRDRRSQTLAAKIPASGRRDVLRRMDPPTWQVPVLPPPPPPPTPEPPAAS